MSCEENYQNQAAYHDLEALIELTLDNINDIEEQVKKQKKSIDRQWEIHDRLSDLLELVNIEKNNVENNYEGEEHGSRV